MARTPTIIAVALLLALPAGASAQAQLSTRRAAAEAQDVASYVAGVISSEYDVHGYAVKGCATRSTRRVACRVRWDVRQRRTRARWRCDTRVLLWLDRWSDTVSWDNARVVCSPRRTRAARRD